MGNVNLPTPVVVAVGALCVLAGYLLGIVAGPDGPERTVGTVESFDSGSNELCLSGEAVAALEDAARDGADDDLLCGRWQRSSGSDRPEEGDEFRFVTERITDDPDAADDPEAGQVLIYGAVVD